MKLTKLEKKVLKEIARIIIDEQPEAVMVSDNTNISIKQLRGVLSSLVKKDLIYIDDDSDTNKGSERMVHFIELTDKGECHIKEVLNN